MTPREYWVNWIETDYRLTFQSSSAACGVYGNECSITQSRLGHTCGTSTLQQGEICVCDANRSLCGFGTVKNGTLLLLFYSLGKGLKKCFKKRAEVI